MYDESKLIATKAEESKQFKILEMEELYRLREENYRLQTLVELYKRDMDELYTHIFLVTEFMKKGSDRKRMRSILKRLEDCKKSQRIKEREGSRLRYSEYDYRFDEENIRLQNRRRYDR